MNIRLVRKKINSVSNVKKITSAMEMVSSIKMKKAQAEAIDGMPYQNNLEKIIKDITAKIDPHFSYLLQPPKEVKDRELALVISTNKGLCGAYNFNLFRFINKNLNSEKTDFIVVGKKAALFINKIGGKIVADFLEDMATICTSAIFQLASSGFLKGDYRQVSIFYNKFVSTLNNIPTHEVLLPISYLTDNEPVSKNPEEYLIEPDPRSLVDQLLRSYVEEKIRNCLIQAKAGEHSSRMIAMKKATENVNDIIYNLTLLHNKIRQEKITYELLDMVTAKISVES